MNREVPTLFIDLLERIGNQDHSALTELYAQTSPLLAVYIRRVVKDTWNADEVLQDVYIYIWLNAGAYRRERGTPMAWFYMLARSRALDSLRRDRKDWLVLGLDEQVRPRQAADGGGRAS